MRLRLLAACATLLFGSVMGAIAGGSSAGGGAQIAPITDNASVSYKSTTGTIPGGNAQVSASGSGVQSGGFSTSSAGSPSTGDSSSSGSGSSNANASSSGSASSNGTSFSSSRDNAGFDGSARSAGSASNIALEVAREKVIETSDKGIEQEKKSRSEPIDKTFAPGLLDSVSDISAVGAQKAQSSASNDGDSRSKVKPAASEDKGDSHSKN